MSPDETMSLTAALAGIRDELTVAISTEQRRSRQRRRTTTVVLAVAGTLAAVGTSVAASTGLFSPAPDDVKNTFRRLDPTTVVDGSKAVAIGVIDDHAVYAAPTADGGFCLNFVDNPRSGPSGTTCLAGGARPGEVALDVSIGTDGGFVFGRVGNEEARTVRILVPAGGGTLTTPVGEERFFLAELTERATRAVTVELPRGPNDPPTKDGGPIEAIDQTRIDAITATAMDARGKIVARGVNASLPDPGVPTETGPTG